MIDEALIRQLLAKASVVANETEDSANDANRIGTLFADVIRALDMAVTEEEIQQLIEEFGGQLFLSKVNPDTAAGRIAMADGIQLGQTYAGGLTGHGGLLDASGRGEMRSLRLWEWLEVPELRYNRVRVIVGDEWQSPGGGIIESVDTSTQTLRLKLEDGEIGLIDTDDLCMGYWHSATPADNSADNYDDSRNNRRVAGFYTCYFRITNVSGANNDTAEYVLRGTSAAYPVAMHPAAGMHFVVFGNPTNTERQASAYRTRTYTRYVRNVTTWEFEARNVAMQFGDLVNLNLLGIDVRGYSAYLDNIYMRGHIEQVEVSGLHFVITLQNGGWVSSQMSEVVTFSVLDGMGRDGSGNFTDYMLTRESGDNADDAVWNAAHTSVTSPITLTMADMGMNWFTRRTLFTLQSVGGRETITQSFTVGVRDEIGLSVLFEAIAGGAVVWADDVYAVVRGCVMFGQEDVTDTFLTRTDTSFTWWRNSGATAEDELWQPTLVRNQPNVIEIRHSAATRQDCSSRWLQTLCCEFGLTVAYTENGRPRQTQGKLTIGNS